MDFAFLMEKSKTLAVWINSKFVKLDCRIKMNLNLRLYILYGKLGLELECEIIFKLTFKTDKMNLANLLPFTTTI